MGWGAILAGVITCFTALFKYSISSAIHAPFLVAIGHSLNYTVSFLLMQAGGFLLASKMPAATAATLVDAMEDPKKITWPVCRPFRRLRPWSPLEI